MSDHPKFVYSGECRLCETGVEAPFKASGGEMLHTGDIVAIYTERDGGVDYFGGLTAVVSDQFQTWREGTGYVHRDNPGPLDFYVMGIRNVEIDSEGTAWRVSLVKKFSDVVEGEHWPAFGFRYANE